MSPNPAFGGPDAEPQFADWVAVFGRCPVVGRGGGGASDRVGWRDLRPRWCGSTAVEEFPDGNPFAATTSWSRPHLLEPPQASIGVVWLAAGRGIPRALLRWSSVRGSLGRWIGRNPEHGLASPRFLPRRLLPTCGGVPTLPGVPPQWMASPEGNMRFVVRGLRLAVAATSTSTERLETPIWPSGPKDGGCRRAATCDWGTPTETGRLQVPTSWRGSENSVRCTCGGQCCAGARDVGIGPGGVASLSWVAAPAAGLVELHFATRQEPRMAQ